MKTLKLSALVAAFAASAFAAPLFEQTNVFEAEKGGYAHYRVPAIVVTAKGTVLAFTEARKSAGGDWGVQDILMRRSDDGKTWSAPRSVARVEGEVMPNPVALAQGLDEPGATTYNNFVPIVDHRSGALHAVFVVEYNRVFYTRSDDDAETFAEPVEITDVLEGYRREYDWKAIAVGPGHGVQLSSGRLLTPLWMSTGEGGHAHRPSCVATLYSDDHGETWERGEIVVCDGELKNPSETLPLEAVDGRVMLNIRHESPIHRRAVSYSSNGAGGWSKPIFDEQLLEPVCMGSLIRHSRRPESDRNRILFANPHSSEPRDPAHPEGNHKRQNVSVKLSYDEGQTWPVNKVVEPGTSGYSDLAVGPDGMIYLIYERGTPSDRGTHVKYLTVARFNLEWLTDGDDR